MYSLHWPWNKTRNAQFVLNFIFLCIYNHAAKDSEVVISVIWNLHRWQEANQLQFDHFICCCHVVQVWQLVQRNHVASVSKTTCRLHELNISLLLIRCFFLCEMFCLCGDTMPWPLPPSPCVMTATPSLSIYVAIWFMSLWAAICPLLSRSPPTDWRSQHLQEWHLISGGRGSETPVIHHQPDPGCNQCF